MGSRPGISSTINYQSGGGSDRRAYGLRGNQRSGDSLKTYEILKGKLLGEIDRGEVDQDVDIWDSSLNEIETRAEGEVDDFFRTCLRSRFADTRE